MFANMSVSLFQHGRIETTTPKAKELRSHAEKLITLAKRGDLHARRQAQRTVRDHAVLSKLFGEIAERFKDRQGGYTRVIAVRNRVGDNAPMSIIELVGAAEAVDEVAIAEAAIAEAAVEAVTETDGDAAEA